MEKLSYCFKLLKMLGFNYSEDEYGQISFFQIIRKCLKTYKDGFLLKFVMNSWLLSPILPRKLRPAILRNIGCKVGTGVFIGEQVYIDSGYADMIELGDNVHITARCLLLCHKRNIFHYRKGDDSSKLSYSKGKIHICRGAMIGMNTMIMPGVTVGEGAIVGAYSHVTQDIPAWTIAVGRPAKVIKIIPERK